MPARSDSSRRRLIGERTRPRVGLASLPHDTPFFTWLVGGVSSRQG